MFDDKKPQQDNEQEGRTKCNIYSRVVGYLSPIKNWNNGKREEFKDRVEYKAPKKDKLDK